MCPTPPGRHCCNCVEQICGVELLKSLTRAEMRISIKTDPGWSLLVAKLHCYTALNGEVCNYIPLNNWNHCPLAISSSHWMFNITSFIYQIFHMLQSFKCHTGFSEEAQCQLGQIWTLVSVQTSVLLAVTQHDFNRLSHLMLADTTAVICKAVVVICRRGRCSGHSALINCRWGLWQGSRRVGLVSSLSQ